MTTLSERIAARECAHRWRDHEAGGARCIDCGARTWRDVSREQAAEGSPAWVQRMARNTYVREGGR